MKRFIAVALLAFLALGLPSGASSQDYMGVSVAADVLFPFGTFGDVYNTGFGGDAQFLYAIDRGMMTGY